MQQNEHLSLEQGSEDKSVNTYASMMYISTFAGYVFPFFNIIVPLILWLNKKNESLFINRQGKEVLNFQISFTLYVFLWALTGFAVVLGGYLYPTSISLSWFYGLFGLWILTLIVMCIILLVYTVIGAYKVYHGINYTLPFKINFIK